ncbi:hypothetical protein FMM75_14720 [Lachnospiraceae bacterium MD335]|jgi:hypothetical protein|nr:hypothetical protein C809_03183 [Lachnospiraceae bacterium MD335]NDO50590.1 hypothetical protein [Lachnospiraceae bacterium MD335]
MAGVSWNSSSMNSFFNNSLNLKTSGMNSIFGTVGDSRMIKSGSYKKLMKSYFDTVDTDDYQKKTSTSGSRHANSYTYDPKEGSSSTDKSSSSSSTSTSKSRHACTYTYDPQRSTISTVRNKVLDKLLDKSEKKPTTSSNKFLNELLQKDKDKAEASGDGTVTDKTDTTTNTGTVTEATAGTVIDESV